MDNNIKKEFEVYIKYLTTAICKEIYLEDIKKEVQQLQEVIEDYKRVMEQQEQQIKKNEKKNRMITVTLILSIVNCLLGSGILIFLLMQ